MTLTVRDSPFTPPLLKTDKASWVDIRDRSGHLIMIIMFMPGGDAFLISSKADPDFKATAENFKIPLYQEPKAEE